MRCEVVAIGTELLLGQIIDTNSSWIGEQLALAGIDSHFQTKVGDNLDRMIEVLRQAVLHQVRVEELHGDRAARRTDGAVAQRLGTMYGPHPAASQLRADLVAGDVFAF